MLFLTHQSYKVILIKMITQNEKGEKNGKFTSKKYRENVST